MSSGGAAYFGKACDVSISNVREVTGARAAVSTGDPAATRAACQILASGGSVVDAAIAASAVLAVVMPHATSIGGDAFILVRDAPTGKIHGLNASGTAPLSVQPATFRDGMHQRGASAAVVPGLVRAWDALHERFGILSWDSLFEDSLLLAERGCAVSPSLAQTISTLEGYLKLDPGWASTFFPLGTPLKLGDTLNQPALARTLRSIADLGADALYRGDAGEALIQYIQSAGGLLSLTDLEKFSVSWVEPVSTEYHGHDVFVMPPNSYGVLMLMQLQCLAALPLEEITTDLVKRMSWQIRAMRACVDVWLPEIGDPACMKVSTMDFLADQSITDARMRMLAQLPPEQAAPAGGTTSITVSDAEGNAVCIVQSIYNPCGAHFIDPNTGMILNNRMFCFDHRPARPNSIAPGKRSAHTLNPVMVTKNGSLRWVYASPGGISQTITGAQILVNLIDRKLEVGPAIDETRWAVDRGGKVLIEPSVAATVLPALAAQKIPAKCEEDDYLFGSATLIQCEPNCPLRAAADLRRNASAMAI